MNNVHEESSTLGNISAVLLLTVMQGFLGWLISLMVIYLVGTVTGETSGNFLFILAAAISGAVGAYVAINFLGLFMKRFSEKFVFVVFAFLNFMGIIVFVEHAPQVLFISITGGIASTLVAYLGLWKGERHHWT